MKSYDKRSGFHLAPVISIVGVVILLGVVGFLFWNNVGKKTAGDVALDVASQKVRAECEKEADKDICKFLTNWKQSEKYRMTSVTEDGTKSVYEMDGNNTRMKTDGEYAYEVITIGKVTYTKAGSTWYKSSIKPREGDTMEVRKVEFDEPADSSNEENKSTTTYKLIGKEACGNMQCFKYQIVDSTDSSATNYVWFDDEDYLIRKSSNESADGKYETTYEYDNISVKEPSPVKDLAPDEFIMPGATEPTKSLEFGQ